MTDNRHSTEKQAPTGGWEDFHRFAQALSAAGVAKMPRIVFSSSGDYMAALDMLPSGVGHTFSGLQLDLEIAEKGWLDRTVKRRDCGYPLVDVIPVRLRPNLVAHIAGIPWDLTAKEAERLSKVILAFARVDIEGRR